MIELINKWDVVNKLIHLENEFQHYKPFEGFEHAMDRKLCELEIEIGKTPGIGWIPVTDRLPECDQVVLCYKADRGVRIGKHLSATYADGVSAFKDCCRDYAFGATHWMPLPEPPSESTVTVEDECNDEDWGS